MCSNCVLLTSRLYFNIPRYKLQIILLFVFTYCDKHIAAYQILYFFSVSRRSATATILTHICTMTFHICFLRFSADPISFARSYPHLHQYRLVSGLIQLFLPQFSLSFKHAFHLPCSNRFFPNLVDFAFQFEHNSCLRQFEAISTIHNPLHNF